MFLFSFVVAMTSGIDVSKGWGFALLMGTFVGLLLTLGFPIDLVKLFGGYSQFAGLELILLLVIFGFTAPLLALFGVGFGVATKQIITYLAKDKIPDGILSTRLFSYSALALVMLVVVAMGAYGPVSLKVAERMEVAKAK